MEGIGSYLGKHAVLREELLRREEKVADQSLSEECLLNVRLGINFPVTLGRFSGVFVHICMQVLAVIVHFQMFFFSWVVWFEVRALTLTGAVFTSGDDFTVGTHLATHRVMKKRKKLGRVATVSCRRGGCYVSCNT